MKKSIVMFCCFLGLASTLSAQPNTYIKDRTGILAGRQPKSIDLAWSAWNMLPAELRQDIPGRPSAMEAYYIQGSKSFFLTVFSVFQDQGRATEFRFNVTPKGWQIEAFFAKSVDRLETELNRFWNTPRPTSPVDMKGAPLISDSKLTSDLVNVFMRLDGDLGYRIRIRPTSWQGRPVIDRARDRRELRELIAQWRIESPLFCGVTKAIDNSAVLWCETYGSLWGFLWRQENGQWMLDDWTCYSTINENVLIRMCAIDFQTAWHPTAQSSVGGSGTVLSLRQLNGNALSQQIVRFYRWAGLNNQAEVDGFLDTAIKQSDRQKFWHRIQAGMATFKFEQVNVTTLANGQIVVSYSTPEGPPAIQCSLLSSGQLRVLAVNVSSKMTSKTMTISEQPAKPRSTEDRVKRLIDEAIVAARAGDARRYFVPEDEIDGRYPMIRSDSELIRWLREGVLIGNGQYAATAYRRLRGQDFPIGELILIEPQSKGLMLREFSVNLSKMKIFQWGLWNKATSREELRRHFRAGEYKATWY